MGVGVYLLVVNIKHSRVIDVMYIVLTHGDTGGTRRLVKSTYISIKQTEKTIGKTIAYAH